MKKTILLCTAILILGCSKSSEKIEITSTSKEAVLLYHKALELENMLKIDEAEKVYEKAILLDSSFAIAHLKIGMLRDNFEKRKQHLAIAMNNIDKISEGERIWILARNKFYGTQEGLEEYEYFKQLVNLYPNDENANYLFGFVHMHHGKKEPVEAALYLKKAISIDSKFSKAYNELAYAYMSKQDFTNAEETIKEYMNLLPNHENPYDTYAEMLMRNHRYQESLDAYTKVLEINPEAPWAIMGASTNLSILGRYTQARSLLDKMNDIPLSDYEYRHKWRARICAYLTENKIDSAITTLQQQYNESASGVNKREPIFHQYIAFSRITRLYFENNESEKGMNSYSDWKNFVSSNITNESTINNVKNLESYYTAYTSYLNENYLSAKQLLRNEGDRNSDENLLFSKILLKEGDIDEAIKILEQLDSDNSYYQYWLLQAYRMNNMKNKSELVIERIKSLIEINNLDYALVVSKLIEKS